METTQKAVEKQLQLNVWQTDKVTNKTAFLYTQGTATQSNRFLYLSRQFYPD